MKPSHGHSLLLPQLQQLSEGGRPASGRQHATLRFTGLAHAGVDHWQLLAEASSNAFVVSLLQAAAREGSPAHLQPHVEVRC